MRISTLIIAAACVCHAQQSVTITKITDMRRFAIVQPSVNTTPFILPGDPKDKAFQSTVIGLEKNWTVTITGSSVETMVRSEMESAFQDVGYRVVDAGGLPVEVDIVSLWCWAEPGFWYTGINFKGALDVRCKAFRSEQGREYVTATIDNRHHTGGAIENWRTIASDGVKALCDKVKDLVKQP